MSLSRKHFVAVADIISGVRAETKKGYYDNLDNDSQIQDIVDDLARYFAGENNLFDSSKFKKACE